MPTEQRIVSDKKIGGGKIGGGGAAPAAEEAEAPKKGKKKLFLLIAVGAVLGLAAGAYFFLFAPKGEEAAAEGEHAAAEAEAEPVGEPGEVLTVEPISINLAEGHYLRLGLALQLTVDVGEHAPDPSVALDKAIALYSGRTMAEVNDAANREALKTQLKDQLAEAFHGAVMDVYLTTYVTQ